MGIINVTPDSFYDGGRRLDPDRAVADGIGLVEAGADVIDIGGESTRPGARPVSLEEELQRVLPVIRGLRRTVNVPISIDTYKAPVARAALSEGADIVNDISALRFDPQMAVLVAAEKVPVVLMHMQGTPQTMQAEPCYDNVLREVQDFLTAQVHFAIESGVEPREHHHRSRHRLRQDPRSQPDFAERPAGARVHGTTAAGRRVAQSVYRENPRELNLTSDWKAVSLPRLPLCLVGPTSFACTT